jgi:hypothetical protein
LIFFKKIKKTGNQTLFYFAAGGGEILVIHPHFMGLYNKSIDDPLTKKYFVWRPVFWFFLRKNQKTGLQTSFHFAAEGGEMLFHTTPPAGKPQKYGKTRK